jgi:hypothetical protein
MTDQQDQMWDMVSLDGETLLRAFTDYHGMQLLDDGFAEFLVDEGLMEQPDDDEENDDDEEDEEPEGPGDDDYVILDCGPLGSKTAVCVQSGWADKSKYKQFDTEEEAVKAIKEDIRAQCFWPSVWREDDHGGITLYDMAD